MTSPCDVIFELLCFYIEHNDNIQGVPNKVNPFKFKSAITYCSNSLMRPISFPEPAILWKEREALG
jgi:hypothetical protein